MFLKILFTVLTLLIVLATLGFAVWGIFLHQPILIVSCLALTAIFGYFSYADVRYWITYFSQQK